MNSRDIARSERDRSELIASRQPVEQLPRRRKLPDGAGIIYATAVGLLIWALTAGALILLHEVAH